MTGVTDREQRIDMVRRIVRATDRLLQESCRPLERAHARDPKARPARRDAEQNAADRLIGARPPAP